MTPIYPLTLTVDHRSAKPQITITNAQGQTVINGQGLLSLHQSKIELTADPHRGPRRYIVEPTQPGFQLNSPFDIWDERDRSMGMIQRPQWWNSRYQIDDRQQRPAFSIAAQNPQKAWASRGGLLVFLVGFLVAFLPRLRIFGYCLIGVALLGLFLVNTGHLFNAPYWVERINGRRVMQFTKNPSISDRRASFMIQAIDAVNETEQLAILCGIILIALRYHGERDSA
jgi:hypothetical protein